MSQGLESQEPTRSLCQGHHLGLLESPEAIGAYKGQGEEGLRLAGTHREPLRLWELVWCWRGLFWGLQ